MFFPLRDENPSRSFPIVTVGLILANTLVFIYQVSLGEGAQGFVTAYGAVPAAVMGVFRAKAHAPLPASITLLTHMFLHGGLLHLLGNMWFLWIFGDNVEDAMGRLRFLAFYLIGGLAAAASHIAAAPHSTQPMVGASGAIAAVLGAYVLLYPKARVQTLFFFFIIIRIIRVPAFVYLGFWFVLQVVSSYSGGPVAWFAHIGGFIAGMVLTPFFVKNRKPPRRWMPV